MAPKVGAGQDDRPKNVEPRWDPAYSPTEFVPDHDETFGNLASAYDTLGGAASDAQSALQRVIPASWKGGAAKACTTYISDLTNYIHTAISALAEASAAVKKAQRPIYDADNDANTASNDANAVQVEYNAWQQRGGAKSEPFFQGFLHEAQYQNRLDLAVTNGNIARGKALTADKVLAAALTGPDHTLSSAKEPTIPNPTDQADPDDAGLLATIMQPVNANLKADGDTTNARNAVDAYNQALKDDPSGKKAKALLEKGAKDLSPAELSYLLDHLDEKDLATAFGQANPKTDRDFYNTLAKKADTPILERLADTDPNHYWHPATGGDNYIWGDPKYPDGPLPNGLDDLHQGELGDCHDMALLGAIQKADPNFLADHVQRNANGTYTVTLYDKNGNPAEVTITPDMPSGSNYDGTLDGPLYAHDQNGDNWDQDATLYEVYEKAMAQSNMEIGPNDKPGYTGMDGGNTNDDIPIVTGKHSTNYPNGDISPQTVQDALDQHKPITVSTLGDDNANGPLYDDKRVPHLIPGHEYYVDSIDPKTHQVTVVNPWGRESESDGKVTISWDQYQQYLSDTQVAG